MAERIECSEYNSERHSCNSGHVPCTSACAGISCGSVVPACMKEDRPDHLIRDDGYPLLWGYEHD